MGRDAIMMSFMFWWSYIYSLFLGAGPLLLGTDEFILWHQMLAKCVNMLGRSSVGAFV